MYLSLINVNVTMKKHTACISNDKANRMILEPIDKAIRCNFKCGKRAEHRKNKHSGGENGEEIQDA